MPRGDQLARQWRIIQTLITSRRGKSAAELAKRSRMPSPDAVPGPRSPAGGRVPHLHREGGRQEPLVPAGYPEAPHPHSLQPHGTHGPLLQHGTCSRPSRVQLFTIPGLPVPRRSRATLPPESMKYLKNVQQTLQVGIKPYKDYARFKEIINRVNEAALQKKSVEMVYYTMSRKKGDQAGRWTPTGSGSSTGPST